MQTEEEETSSPMMDPWSIFLYGMKAPMTREKYIGSLAEFFDFIGLTEGTTAERAKTFTERGKKEPDWVFVNVLRFAQAQKETITLVYFALEITATDCSCDSLVGFVNMSFIRGSLSLIQVPCSHGKK